MKEVKQYNIFLASPGGLTEERRLLFETVAAYNREEAEPSDALFFVVGWEQALRGVGRPQAKLNECIRSSDYFVLILWDRWGSSPLPPEQEEVFSSAVEEELKNAIDCYRDPGMPMRHVVVFFKAVDHHQMSDPGAQLSKVLEFRQELERDKKLFYETFETQQELAARIRMYLGQWRRDHEQGNLEKVLPTDELVEKLVFPSTGATASVGPEAKVDSLQALLEQARVCGRNGQLTDAELL